MSRRIDPAIKKARKAAYLRDYQAAHREELQAYLRDYHQKRKAAMTPEELEARRERNRAKAMEHYWQHREKILAREKTPEARAKLNAWARQHRANKPKPPQRLPKSAEEQRLYDNAYQREYYQRNLAKKRGQARQHTSTYRANKRHAPQNDLTPAQWLMIQEAQHYCCAYCGRQMQRLEQDHITPLSKGGSHTLHNVVAACRSCNARKNAGSPPKPVQPLLL